MATTTKAARIGEEVWKTRTEKINVEVLTLTYGTLVAQLCKDLTLPNTTGRTDYDAVNEELDRMGYNIGLRLIEDFLAKTNYGTCTSFRETGEAIAKVGFKVFLNTTPRLALNEKEEGRSFNLIFDENPLADFVELPDDGRAQNELWFSNLLCGVIRGALEMVQMQVEAHFISDILRGDEETVMKVTLVRFIEDEMPVDDE